MIDLLKGKDPQEFIDLVNKFGILCEGGLYYTFEKDGEERKFIHFLKRNSTWYKRYHKINGDKSVLEKNLKEYISQTFSSHGKEIIYEEEIFLTKDELVEYVKNEKNLPTNWIDDKVIEELSRFKIINDPEDGSNCYYQYLFNYKFLWWEFPKYKNAYIDRKEHVVKEYTRKNTNYIRGIKDKIFEYIIGVYMSVYDLEIDPIDFVPSKYKKYFYKSPVPESDYTPLELSSNSLTVTNNNMDVSLIDSNWVVNGGSIQLSREEIEELIEERIQNLPNHNNLGNLDDIDL